MAEENQAVQDNAEAPPPATPQGGPARTGPPLGTISTLTLLILLGTAVLYAGVVLASSTITRQVVAPRLSVWLAEREVERILAKEATDREVPPFGEVYLIEDLVVNPEGSAGMRYACVSVGLESTSADVIQELQLRDAQIKDMLIQIFSSKTVEELVDVRAREAIRVEVKRKVEDVLPPEGLDAVYFVNFVLQ
jgi:flagellar basal body-associated protein FliL